MGENYSKKCYMKKTRTFIQSLEQFKDQMEKQKKLITVLISVKAGKGLINWILNLKRLISAKAPTKSDVRIIKAYLKSLYLIQKGSGIPHLIKYLKTCSVLLQQHAASDLTRPSSREVGGVAVSLTRRGLPRIIPRLQRSLIRKGDPRVIKYWLSLFNIYRYIESTYKLKGIYDTITEGNKFVPSVQCYRAIALFWKALGTIVGKRLIKHGPGFSKPKILNSVSVTIREQDQIKGSSLWATVTSIHLWRIWQTVWINEAKTSREKKTLKLVKALSLLMKKYWPDGTANMLGSIGWNPSIIDQTQQPSKVTDLIDPKTTPRSAYIEPNTELVSAGSVNGLPILGRLVKLYEAAGKVRIIAIVDPITNWVLQPIHSWLFSILRNIPQDGTFNQEKPILNLLKENSDSTDKFIGSADMSAATDRLPVLLQEKILAHILGPSLAKAWRTLLVDRPYFISSSKYLFYNTGQPMGALSSWASLAITHHFMWQWAAWRSKVIPWGVWFKSYAVLGDDSASKFKLVVDSYLDICRELGVKVNLAKSLLSVNGSLEFAKRFFTPRGNCSPISIGELFVSKVNFSVMSNLPRKCSIRIHDLSYIMGYRHRITGALDKKLLALPRKIRHMIIVTRSPWGSFPLVDFVSWINMISFSRVKSKEISYPGIVVLQMVSRLLPKIDKIILKNALPLQMFGIGSDKLTGTVRHTDPKTCIAVLSTVYEPIRKDIFKDARSLKTDLLSFEKDLRKNAFLYTVSDLNNLMGIYFELQDRLHNIRPFVYLQDVEKPFIQPSPRKIVKLWNSFNSK